MAACSSARILRVPASSRGHIFFGQRSPPNHRGRWRPPRCQDWRCSSPSREKSFPRKFRNVPKRGFTEPSPLATSAGSSPMWAATERAARPLTRLCFPGRGSRTVSPNQRRRHPPRPDSRPFRNPSSNEGRIPTRRRRRQPRGSLYRDRLPRQSLAGTCELREYFFLLLGDALARTNHSDMCGAYIRDDGDIGLIDRSEFAHLPFRFMPISKTPTLWEALMENMARASPISELRFPSFMTRAPASYAGERAAPMHSLVVVLPEEPVTPIRRSPFILRRCSRARFWSPARGESTSIAQA